MKAMMILQVFATSRSEMRIYMKRNYSCRLERYLSLVCILAVAVSLMMSGERVQAKTFKKGFTYQKLPAHIRKKITGVSYRKNRHIKYRDLRYVKVRYYDFDGVVQEGELIVNKKIADKTVRIFYELYKIKYPIERIALVDEYGADDEKSMRANNSSAFNYRTVAGTSRLSKHALGMAIDINPRINPYINRLTPANAKIYRNRDEKKCKGKYASHMIQPDSKITKIFKKYGFTWGGDWKYSKDYQHFQM